MRWLWERLTRWEYKLEEVRTPKWILDGVWISYEVSKRCPLVPWWHCVKGGPFRERRQWAFLEDAQEAIAWHKGRKRGQERRRLELRR